VRKIFIIAGEASGDLHGSNLVKSLLSLDPTLTIQAYGGPKMQKAGAEIVRSFEDNAFMGFFEVVQNLRSVLKNLEETRELIQNFRPDHIIFIDFPSFNLRIAKHLKKVNPSLKMSYYISPKVWAWKSGRVHKLDRLMDNIYVIFPFEEAFYEKYGYKVTYVGNPLLDEIDYIPATEKDSKLTAVLPGSRRQEITKMLPVFAQLSKEMPEQVFEVSVMDYIPLEFYRQLAGDVGSNFQFSTRKTYEILKEASTALVTSGTATLETALFNVPQVVAYKTSQISFWIAKQVVKVKYISLVNLILDKAAITELVQDSLTVENLKTQLKEIINNPEPMARDYDQLRQLLGAGGASNKVAEDILKQF
jgi:lipid-A-disaccharide synthase